VFCNCFFEKKEESVFLMEAPRSKKYREREEREKLVPVHLCVGSQKSS